MREIILSLALQYVSQVGRASRVIHGSVQPYSAYRKRYLHRQQAYEKSSQLPISRLKFLTALVE